MRLTASRSEAKLLVIVELKTRRYYDMIEPVDCLGFAALLQNTVDDRGAMPVCMLPNCAS